MQRNVLVSLILLVLSISACGGGGGGGGTSTVVVSGMASKGPFISGTVNVYDVSGGTGANQRKLLGSGGINNDGTYEVNIVPTSNPVMLEVAAPLTNAPQYKDEANNGALRTLETPLRALLPGVTGNFTAVVTPFTELAARRAGDSPTIADVESANNLVSQLYQVPNIVSTIPVDATAAIQSGTAMDRINYGLALAAVSQLMKTEGVTLGTALNTLSIQTGDTIGSAPAFKSAVTAFLNATDYPIETHIPSIEASPFVNVGAIVTTTLQANKENALANGDDTVIVTATFSEILPDETEITFTVSGGARFAEGATSVTAKTSGNQATATLTSATAGDSVVTATYLPGSAANATITFVVVPAVIIQASRSATLPNGTATITLTATPASVVAGYDAVTFAITSGTGSFDNGQSSKVVPLSGGTATVGVVSTTAGPVGITATYAVTSMAAKTVSFSQAKTAVVEVGLKNSYSNVYSLNFRMGFTPTGSVTGDPVVVAINEAAGVAGQRIAPLSGVFNGVATIFMVKDVSASPGYTIVANKPVVRLTYSISGTVLPEFQLNIDPQNNSALVPLELSDPADPTHSIAQVITAADYYVNVYYVDDAGNTLWP